MLPCTAIGVAVRTALAAHDCAGSGAGIESEDCTAAAAPVARAARVPKEHAATDDTVAVVRTAAAALDASDLAAADGTAHVARTAAAAKR